MLAAAAGVGCAAEALHDVLAAVCGDNRGRSP